MLNPLADGAGHTLTVWRAERATILVFGRPEQARGAEFSRDALRDLRASRIAGELR